MTEYEYVRDLPDGSRSRSKSAWTKLSDNEIYFDDFIAVEKSDNEKKALEFYFFGKEQSYPERSLDRILNEYTIHYVTDGCGTVNGRRVVKGQGFLLFPGQFHNITSDKTDPWHFKWIAFGGRDAGPIMRSIGLNEQNCFFDFDFTSDMERLVDDLIYKDHDGCDINTYIHGIFFIILSHHKKQGAPNGTLSDGSVKYADAAMRYIDEHYREDIKIDNIAKAQHISRKYLCAVFYKHMGMSTKEYLLSRRVEAASSMLLNTDMTVSEISAKVGYGDYTQLSRLFKKKMGMSPKQYRKIGVRNVDEVNFLRSKPLENKR